MIAVIVANSAIFIYSASILYKYKKNQGQAHKRNSRRGSEGSTLNRQNSVSSRQALIRQMSQVTSQVTSQVSKNAKHLET